MSRNRLKFREERGIFCRLETKGEKISSLLGGASITVKYAIQCILRVNQIQ